MQKPPGVIDMDYFIVGRATYDQPAGALKHNVSLRTGFFGGHVQIGDIPNSKRVPVKSIYSPEGILLILPFRKGSPGYQIFEEMPLFKLKNLQEKFDNLQIKVSQLMEEAEASRSPEQLKEMIYNIGDMMSTFKNDMGQENTGMVALPGGNKPQPQVSVPGAR